MESSNDNEDCEMNQDENSTSSKDVNKEVFSIDENAVDANDSHLIEHINPETTMYTEDQEKTSSSHNSVDPFASDTQTGSEQQVESPKDKDTDLNTSEAITKTVPEDTAVEETSKILETPGEPVGETSREICEAEISETNTVEPSKQVSMEISEEVEEKTCREISEEAPKTTSVETSEEIPMEVSGDVAEEISKNTNKDISAEPSEESNEVIKETSKEDSEKTSKKTSGEVSEEMPLIASSTESKEPISTASQETKEKNCKIIVKNITKSSFALKKNIVVNEPENKSQEDECEDEISVPESQKDSYFCVVQNVEVHKTCMVCNKLKLVKYNCRYKDQKTYICHDTCLYRLQKSTNLVIVHEYFTKFYCPVQIDSGYKFIRVCKQCNATLKNVKGVISWEAVDFCKEHCLYRYQKWNNKLCAECKKSIAFNQLGKYGVRFGSIMRQFCSSQCLETKKKKIRICSYCQKSIRRTKTMLGTKFFCHDICKGMYEHLQKPNKPPFLLNPDDASCYVCKLTRKPLQIEFDYHRSSLYFCTINCFTIFKFVQNCDPPPKRCHTCSKYCLQQYLEHNAIFYDNLIHYFCSKTCQYIYIITHRRVVPCLWCKVKKYNFDMIQKSNFYDNTIFTCSLNCLNQLKIAIEAVRASKTPCFNCVNEMGVYTVKLVNGTMKSFCSNQCINIYQNQFSAPPPPVVTNDIAPYKRTRGRTKKSVENIPDKPGPLPVITSVCSLAPTAVKGKGNEALIRKIILIMSAKLPEQRNVSTMAGPTTEDKEIQIYQENVEAEIQTDVPEQGMKIVPILVTIYIPCPLPIWKAPVPSPVPFPLIIPCPILVPLTKNTSNVILKDLQKKVQVKAPADPFEAELLMMAELVAAEKKDDANAEVESEREDAGGVEESYSPEPTDTNNTFGDDMLQMALKMATDFEEQPVDLEGALTASTITPSQQQAIEDDSVEDVDDPQPMEAMNVERPTIRRKRGGGGGGGGGSGGGGVRQTRHNPTRRARRAPQSHMDYVVHNEQTIYPPEPVEKPDANMCLKYTFGVNAWHQWVLTKNTELERSSQKLKLFKTELLQLTADELNYALCLFVKEVRKPNGSEYAPDTIYYLCLGIQQYLYENGRIDNIFCDPYYEKFTDCLDEVCQKFSQLYSDSHYIVTRVEEEHLWECKQLGAHSPHVLLTTLMFFNTKHFNLTNVEEHMQLSFSHIMKHWKRSINLSSPVKPGHRSVLLRFYPPQSALDANSRKKKVYEQQENEEDPLRCPVKLYEFYLSKCPESVKVRSDVFYLLPERSCVPDSPVWYSTMALGHPLLEKMLHRVKMVKEINVALLTN